MGVKGLVDVHDEVDWDAEEEVYSAGSRRRAAREREAGIADGGVKGDETSKSTSELLDDEERSSWMGNSLPSS